jgi:hypothetical protein
MFAVIDAEYRVQAFDQRQPSRFSLSLYTSSSSSTNTHSWGFNHTYLQQDNSPQQVPMVVGSTSHPKKEPTRIWKKSVATCCHTTGGVAENVNGGCNLAPAKARILEPGCKNRHTFTKGQNSEGTWIWGTGGLSTSHSHCLSHRHPRGFVHRLATPSTSRARAFERKPQRIHPHFSYTSSRLANVLGMLHIPSTSVIIIVKRTILFSSGNTYTFTILFSTVPSCPIICERRYVILDWGGNHATGMWGVRISGFRVLFFLCGFQRLFRPMAWFRCGQE